jgi:hypothetical protein
MTADITSINAADLVHDFMSVMIAEKPPKRMRVRNGVVEKV